MALQTALSLQKQPSSSEPSRTLYLPVVFRSVLSKMTPPNRAPFNQPRPPAIKLHIFSSSLGDVAVFDSGYMPYEQVVKELKQKAKGEHRSLMKNARKMSGGADPLKAVTKNDALKATLKEVAKVRSQMKALKSDSHLARRLDFVEGLNGGPALFRWASRVALTAGIVSSAYDINQASLQDNREGAPSIYGFGFGRNLARAIGANAGLWGGIYLTTALAARAAGRLPIGGIRLPFCGDRLFCGNRRLFLCGAGTSSFIALGGFALGGWTAAIGYDYGGRMSEAVYDLGEKVGRYLVGTNLKPLITA